MTFEFILRLFVAGMLGTVIGLEREYRAKEAGYRTHFLVSLGSALIMIVSQYGFEAVLAQSGMGLDPSRIAAQVVTGIGFIGAGTIILNKHVVRGLTTAAGIWATSAIGLCIGSGMYFLGISATALVLIGFEVLSYLFKSVGFKSYFIEFSTHRKDALYTAFEIFDTNNFIVVSYQMEEKKLADTTLYNVSMVIKSKKNSDDINIATYLNGIEDVTIHRIE